MNPPPTSPDPFKAFLPYLLQTWCTWCVSLPPPLTRSALPTLYIARPMSALLVSQPLLQQAPDLLLFLGIFRSRRGFEYLVLPLFTHIREQALTEWMRESRGEWCLTSLHPHSYASIPSFCRGPPHCFFLIICSAHTDQSFHSTDQWTVCLRWILLRQAV